EMPANTCRLMLGRWLSTSPATREARWEIAFRSCITHIPSCLRWCASNGRPQALTKRQGVERGQHNHISKAHAEPCARYRHRAQLRSVADRALVTVPSGHLVTSG